MDADVIVVGAGPAGSVTATLAARAGARVLLLDRARFPRNKACAEYMSPGVLGALHRIGLAETVLARGPLRVPGMDIVAPSGFRFRLQYRASGSSFQALTLPRLQLDHALVTAAVDSGAELEEGVIVREPLTDEGRVRGVIASRAGKELKSRAPLVVVADGARSTMRSALGLDAPLRWPDRVGLIAHYEGPAALDSGFGQMHVSAGGYCGVAPLPGGGVNVGLVLHRFRGRRLPDTPSRLLDGWIAQHPNLAASLAGCARVTPVRGMAPVGARCRTRCGLGFIVTGDAAGFFDPFTGEGIHRALIGAEIASEWMLRGLSQGFDGVNLADYERARRQAFRKKEMVTELVQAFVRFPRLLEHSLPRLQTRSETGDLLGAVLGDIVDPARFLRPGPLWQALRP